MISFLQCIIFELISYSEFILKAFFKISTLEKKILSFSLRIGSICLVFSVQNHFHDNQIRVIQITLAIPLFIDLSLQRKEITLDHATFTKLHHLDKRKVQQIQSVGNES